MPYYNYFCSDCTHNFTNNRSIDERDDPIACPRCESLEVSRFMSTPVLYTKSSGGEMQMISGGSTCGGCVATSCGGCSVKN